ncbi:MAG: hypothetical protein R2815_13200 [Flavobacteriales bacterium]|nr:hypothetical protein [Flavobacteriales bacterium]
MITAELVQRTVERHLADTSHFLVAVELRPGNKVVVEVDNDRAITIAELVALNKAVREDLGEAADEFELQFSSPGMGTPFKVERQYRKHMGRLVDVQLHDGRSVRGQLEGMDGTTLALRIQHPSKVKGRLPKLDPEATSFPFTDIQSTKASITFN